jgi:hypothetical protein
MNSNIEVIFLKKTVFLVAKTPSKLPAIKLHDDINTKNYLTKFSLYPKYEARDIFDRNMSLTEKPGIYQTQFINNEEKYKSDYEKYKAEIDRQIIAAELELQNTKSMFSSNESKELFHL